MLAIDCSSNFGYLHSLQHFVRQVSQPLRTLLVLVAALAIAGCSSTPTTSNSRERTEVQYYQDARDSLDSGNLLLAADKLKNLETFYPFGQFAEQAQLELIYINYMTADRESALLGAERFIRLNPLHPQIDYAYYMRGLITYEMGFGLIESYFSDDVAKRDTAPLQDAFQYFNDLIQRFPDSRYSDDARQRMLFLRDRIASHEIGVARYYVKRHAYIAAANRATNVVTQFPSSRSVADALALMVECYQALSITEEAEQALTLLSTNYPDHPQLVDGQFVVSGLADSGRRSLLSIVTFGFL